MHSYLSELQIDIPGTNPRVWVTGDPVAQSLWTTDGTCGDDLELTFTE